MGPTLGDFLEKKRRLFSHGGVPSSGIPSWIPQNGSLGNCSCIAPPKTFSFPQGFRGFLKNMEMRIIPSKQIQQEVLVNDGSYRYYDQPSSTSLGESSPLIHSSAHPFRLTNTQSSWTIPKWKMLKSCWWSRNPANQLRLAVYHITCKGFIHPRWLAGCLPSTALSFFVGFFFVTLQTIITLILQ